VAADVSVRLGTLRLHVAFSAGPGSVTAILGPNGAGKSTLLRVLAGLIPLDAGRVVLAGEVVDEPPAVLVPPERRRLGIVHQDYLLFPHMSVLDNVAFGPRSRGMRSREARALAATWLARVGLADVSRARPTALSGGQQQRAALARALVTNPAALLLDEPLAALDARNRPRVRDELHAHLAAFPGAALVVTHDPADARALADRLIVLEDGRITHDGPVADVIGRPRTEYVTSLATPAPGHS
jgi:molybdate transport system ATP-binding protein